MRIILQIKESLELAKAIVRDMEKKKKFTHAQAMEILEREDTTGNDSGTSDKVDTNSECQSS